MSLSGTHDKRRRRRTKAQVEQLDKQIIDALRRDHPQSIRHVFYLMTNPRLPEPVEKSEHGYQQVQHRLKMLRRSGQVRYDWITDATRRGYHVATFDGTSDFLRRMQGLYRADLWQQAGCYVEVWAESRSIAGVIEDVCRDLAVSLYPAGGFASITLGYEAAEYISQVTDYGEKPATIIFIGDYDPAGVLIDQAIETELRTHLHPDVDLDFERLAINPDQIREYDLPTKLRIAGERRALHIQETVEAEAMPAHLLRDLLRVKVEGYLPEGALETVKAAEESERRFIGDLANIVREGRV